MDIMGVYICKSPKLLFKGRNSQVILFNQSYFDNLYFLFFLLCFFVWFHINFKIIDSSFVEKAMDIFIRIVMKLQIAFGQLNILTIFFQTIRIISTYQSYLQFISLVSYSFQNIHLSPSKLNLFIGILILFDAIVNEVVLLNF